ncbi:DNA-3-methyladenine glycosylase family protein [Gryllotalpicola protaetiae]|uniref:DNA-3-methyladenine glycosylase 2 family protein n=1 Tax=Gryllotalpicola protaetiae TaxID=2419771 RepID=A0A387BZD2_9MICO|nr:DNA-3-methyladenine glycosylase [Gryllotalpicola protaetiae]AYG03691.1 DNA-3-methyladenine glycosylase 2 family protein [Gryllotalpicola protaetiae]
MTLTDASAEASVDESAGPLSTVYDPALPVDLRATLGPLGRGPYDPTTQWQGSAVWRTFTSPEGPVTLRLEQSSTGAPVRARAWGPGREWAIDGVPRLLGRDDDWSQLDLSRHPFLAETLRRLPGLRLPATRRVFEAMAPAIIEQKVTSLEAYREWARLVTRFGALPPGPRPAMPRKLRVSPTPEAWRAIPSWEWHQAGVDPTRSRTLVNAASRASAIERAENAAILTTLPGIGPWTAAETLQRSHGDPDQVSVGDYHVPHFVGYALAGDRHCDDAGMLELLAPWAGQRQRVVRLILASGRLPERRGPRATLTDHRRR